MYYSLQERKPSTYQQKESAYLCLLQKHKIDNGLRQLNTHNVLFLMLECIQ